MTYDESNGHGPMTSRDAKLSRSSPYICYHFAE